MKKITKIKILEPNQKLEGKKAKHEIGLSQPPKNKRVANELINNILAYSPRKNKAKPIAEYSTL